MEEPAAKRRKIEAKTPDWIRLAPDIVGSIFDDYLTSASQFAFGLACKDFYRPVSRMELRGWKIGPRLELYHDPQERDRWELKYGPRDGIKHLNLIGTDLSWLGGTQTKSIKSAVFDKCIKFTSDFTGRSRFHNLQSLYIKFKREERNCFITQNLFRFLQIPKVIDLTLILPPGMRTIQTLTGSHWTQSNELITEITTKMPCVERLTLGNMQNLSDAAVLAIDAPRLKHITFINSGLHTTAFHEAVKKRGITLSFVDEP